ncbi:MAG: hypothetical protein QOE71_3791, partial [Pseudonocardiales bacterium]|nr:hypothetical protein [Pseudonocardiales bacterium]
MKVELIYLERAGDPDDSNRCEETGWGQAGPVAACWSLHGRQCRSLMSLSRLRVSKRPAKVPPIGVGSARRRGRERGAAAVELALLTPVLLLFVLGIIDFGRLWYTQISLSQAAREGARL